MQYNRYKYFIQLFRRFKILIILYIILLIFLFAFKYYKNIKFDDTYISSWFPAFSEDMFYFFVIGFLGIILGTKLPIDENFEIRAASLANGNFADKRAETFLINEVKNLMTYNKTYTNHITIKKMDSEKKHIFLHVDAECKVVNMCQDQGMPVNISTLVEPGPKIENSYGTINHHSIEYKLSEKDLIKNKIPPSIDYILPQGEIINLNDLNGKSYEKNRNVDVFADGAVVWKLCYDIWVPLDGKHENINNWYFNKFFWYTESFNLTITNEIHGQEFSYFISYINRNFANPISVEKGDESCRLYPDSSKLILSTARFHKNDRVRLLFSII